MDTPDLEQTQSRLLPQPPLLRTLQQNGCYGNCFLVTANGAVVTAVTKALCVFVCVCVCVCIGIGIGDRDVNICVWMWMCVGMSMCVDRDVDDYG